MKFAKELEENLVAEWKEKYLDYKGGKKKLKAVSRAVKNADKPPSHAWARQSQPFNSSIRDGPVQSFLNRRSTNDQLADPLHSEAGIPTGGVDGDTANSHKARAGGLEPPTKSQPRPINERSPLFAKDREQESEGRRLTRYGSIIGSPPRDGSPTMEHLQKQASLLELPDPALDPTISKVQQGQAPKPDAQRPATADSPLESRAGRPQSAQMNHTGNAYEVGKIRDGTPKDAKSPGGRSFFSPKRTNTFSGNRPFMQRMFSVTGSPNQTRHAHEDVALEAYREVDFRQAEFFQFLDKQLVKIEDFYKSKEEEAGDRMNTLREQLHVMRNRRLEEVVQADQHKHKHSSNGDLPDGGASSKANGQSMGGPWIAPVNKTVEQIDHAFDKVRPNRIGKTSRTMGTLGTPEFPPDKPSDQRDYSRRTGSKEVPYRVAKRKLKVALAEYYRGLELLKSYALLNRTAFRKITKKFDKTVNARPTNRYMAEKVNKAYFVNSEVLDGMIHDVEDLYARYFERGSKKVAVGKLRAKIARAGDYTGSIWRQGVMATAGLVFGLQGLVYGVERLNDPNPEIAAHTAYLLQVYGGYFLMLFLVGLFVIDARAFTQAKVNYQFVFEFDSRHMLDWRQLSEMPAVFLFLLGLVMWLNFCGFGGDPMYIYWPVILVGLAVGALFLPAPYFYQRSRGWFLYSNWRLLLAGIYPVEFRDFFLGDMFCSLTYAMGNIELFFCLYARNWNEPAMCNSSNSRLLGFFTTLPGIWRALQCIRRYYDTRNIFPHLVNCGKYCFTILAGMSLSLFRIERSTEMMALFIVFATINGIYCSIWDVIMDWSLGVPAAKNRFLRHKLAYKQIWWYYAAMVIDPILRFNWIFYVIYANDLQHSSAVAFFIGFTEVLRRGLWTLFRVENEHCNNVGRFRASRDVPLPYEIEHESSQDLLDKTSSEDNRTQQTQTAQGEQQPPPSGRTQVSQQSPSEHLSHEGRASATDIEQGHGAPSVASLRRRRPSLANSPIARALRQAGNTMRSAHAQDYERKRKPELGSTAADATKDDEDDDDDDDDDVSSDSDDARRQQPRGARNHVARERRNSSEEDGRRDLEEAEDLVARGQGR